MKCENCQNKHDGTYGSGRFCSSKCARSFARKKDFKSTKIVKCITCQKEIEVSKRASAKLCKCNDCRKCKKQSINIKKEYFCICCKKPLNRNHKYCSEKCHQKNKYIQYIKRWKEGKETGSHKNGFQISGYVRKYLWEKYEEKCSRCGWNTPNPITNKPVLEIEHIDGDCTNNKEENLDLICPNCHSLTPTYKALNSGNGNRQRLKYYKLI